MWNDVLCSQLLPTWPSSPPRCCHRPWYPYRGILCCFDPCALQLSLPFTQASPDASGHTLLHVPGKYPRLSMHAETSTNLTLDIKDSSMDGQKLELPDHEPKAVQPQLMQTIFEGQQSPLKGNPAHAYTRGLGRGRHSQVHPGFPGQRRGQPAPRHSHPDLAV
ncbi:hypothetical protein MRX96_058196 [Rhipicephalus microplus]